MDGDRLRAWVEALCSEECAGRAPGTPGGIAARRIIVEALRGAGLAVHEQPLPAGANVIATAGGTGRTVLVGAHYDHLGRHGGEVYRGADDNAAAVAVLLELGRALAASPPAGRVVLCAFDCEEPPHFLTPAMGSMVFAREPTVPLDEIALAVILDLVGHGVGPPGTPAKVQKSLFALGAEASQGLAARVDRAAAGEDAVVVRRVQIDVIPPLSDYEAFRRAGVPFLFLTCGRWRHYHTPDDTPERLDFGKLAGVARFTLALARAALADERPRFDREARDHAGTVAALIDIARDLQPAAVAPLEAIRARIGPDGRCALSDWSRVLGMVALLEQGLA